MPPVFNLNAWPKYVWHGSSETLNHAGSSSHSSGCVVLQQTVGMTPTLRQAKPAWLIAAFMPSVDGSMKGKDELAVSVMRRSNG
eukprot:1267230-Prymnesium_polylepis.1